jgi:UDP-N-acetylglucosamine transferase subunit ALG13
MGRFEKSVSIKPSGKHSLIFVTVGTTMPFDELLEEVDLLAREGVFCENIICQAGQSRYRLTHGHQFIGRPSIDDLIAESSITITHGGATVLQLLMAQRPFVAFPNPRGAGNHQASFLVKVSEMARISWSANVKDLRELFHQRRVLGPASIRTDVPKAATIIRDAFF